MSRINYLETECGLMDTNFVFLFDNAPFVPADSAWLRILVTTAEYIAIGNF